MYPSMDLTLTAQSTGESNGKAAGEKEAQPAYVSMVDPFLVEALQNPRHRLTILRMELDMQKFLQNSDQQEFEFPNFPTSYLRLAAHRVAQHFGLQTMVLDNGVGAAGIRILAMKKSESKFPVVRLSDVPPKELESDKHDQPKFVIRPRPRDSANGAHALGHKRSPARSVEERKEEYDRARARIFSGPNSSQSDDTRTRIASDVRNSIADDDQVIKNCGMDMERSLYVRDLGSSSRVAIFRDREKDRTDPDYDRSYDRYFRSNLINQSFVALSPFDMQKFQPQLVQYKSVFHQQGQIPSPQTSLSYNGPVMSPYSVVGSNQTSQDALYMPWTTQSMMYAQSYDQLRHTFFQVPFSQQPLTFDYLQNH